MPPLMKPWSVRPPTGGEIAVLAEVYGSAVDTRRLRLWSVPPVGWWVKRAFCPGGTVWPGKSLIVYPPKAALLDFAAPDAPLSALATFVHECCHVAQSQAGVNLLLAKLKAGDSPDAYRYALTPATRWDALNIEQQAMVVEHGFLASRGQTTPYSAAAYAAIAPFPKS